MMRHNRALLRVYQEQGRLTENLAHRHILPMRRIQYTAQEQAAYEALQSYSQALSQQIAAANAQQARVSTGFYLSFLQRRFASSLHAIGETLRRRCERVKWTLDHLLDESGATATAAGPDRSSLDEDPECVARLQDMADAEFRLTAHVADVEADNERSGRAQAALALGTAYGFIIGRQQPGGGDDNFWKELDACRRLIAERTAQGGGLSVQRVPSIYDQVATAFVPFEVKRKISDGSFWVDTAPPPLLNAAFDAAARVADGIKRKKSDLTTDMALSRIIAEMQRLLS